MKPIYSLILIFAMIVSAMGGAKVGYYLAAMATLTPPSPPVPRVLVLSSEHRVEVWLRYPDTDLRVQ